MTAIRAFVRRFVLTNKRVRIWSELDHLEEDWLSPSIMGPRRAELERELATIRAEIKELRERWWFC